MSERFSLQKSKIFVARRSWLAAVFFLFAVNWASFSATSYGGCDWLHLDGWYSRAHKLAQPSRDDGTWNSQTGIAGLEYSDGYLRFRQFPPAAPCDGPQCRKGKAGNNDLPASAQTVRIQTATGSIVSKDPFGLARTQEWQVVSDTFSISVSIAPGTPPPRMV